MVNDLGVASPEEFAEDSDRTKRRSVDAAPLAQVIQEGRDSLTQGTLPVRGMEPNSGSCLAVIVFEPLLQG